MSVPEYSPGEWYGVIVADTAVLLDPSTPAPVVRQVWTTLRERAGLNRPLEALLVDGITGLRPFAAVRVVPEGLHTALRGEAAIVSTRSGTAHRRTAPQVVLWTEETEPAADRVELIAAGSTPDGADQETLPVTEGVVRASRIVLAGVASAAGVEGGTAASATGVAEKAAGAGRVASGADRSQAASAVTTPAAASTRGSAPGSTGEKSTPGALASSAAEQRPSSAGAAGVASGSSGGSESASSAAQPASASMTGSTTPTSRPAPAAPAAPAPASPAPTPAATAPAPTALAPSPAAGKPNPATPQPAPRPAPAPSPDNAVPSPASAPDKPVPAPAPNKAAPAPDKPAPVATAPAPVVPGPASEDDHDGMTILSGELASIRQNLPSWAVSQSGQFPSVPAPAPAPGPQGAVPVAAPAPAPDSFPRVVLSTGVVVPVDGVLLIGRAPQAARAADGLRTRTVAVPSPTQDISRTHAEVRLEGGRVLVTDLFSTNGITVASGGLPPRTIAAGEAVAVQRGEIVDLGDGVTFTVEPPA